MPTLLTRLRSLGLFRSVRQRAMTVETVPGYNRLMALDDDELAELGLRRSDIEAWGAGRIMCIRPLTDRVLQYIEQSIEETAPVPANDRTLSQHAA